MTRVEIAEERRGPEGGGRWAAAGAAARPAPPDLSSPDAFAASYPAFLARFLPAGAAAGWDPVARAADPWGTGPGGEGSIPELEWRLFKSWTRHLEARFTLVHAAVLGREGRVLVLPGVSGCGKTTLALALMRRGYTYLSDDCAVLGPEPWTVWPVPGALHVKGALSRELARAGDGVLAAELPYPERFFFGGQGGPALCAFVAAGRLPSAGRWRVAAVVFPEHRWGPRDRPSPGAAGAAGAPPARAKARAGRLTPVKPGQALVDLTFHSFAREPARLARDFRMLGVLVRAAPCYSLDTRDLDAALPALDRLLDG